jgi:hypothetical protein
MLEEGGSRLRAEKGASFPLVYLKRTQKWRVSTGGKEANQTRVRSVESSKNLAASSHVVMVTSRTR